MSRALSCMRHGNRGAFADLKCKESCLGGASGPECSGISSWCATQERQLLDPDSAKALASLRAFLAKQGSELPDGWTVHAKRRGGSSRVDYHFTSPEAQHFRSGDKHPCLGKPTVLISLLYNPSSTSRCLRH